MKKRKRTIVIIVALLFVIALSVGAFAYFTHRGDAAEAALEKSTLLNFGSGVSLSSDIYQMSAQGNTNSDEYRKAVELRGRLDDLDAEQQIVLSTRGTYLLPWRYSAAVESLLARYEDVWEEIEATED